jgi:hypothetical protein
MHHVRAIQRHTNVRRIFLATENASVIAEAMSRYPEFEWRVARDSASLALERSALNYHMADFVRDHPSQAALVRTASHSKHRCKLFACVRVCRNELAVARAWWIWPHLRQDWPKCGPG